MRPQLYFSGFYLAVNRGPSTEMHERMLKSQDRLQKEGRGNQVELNKIISKDMKGRLKLSYWTGIYFPGEDTTSIVGKQKFLREEKGDPQRFMIQIKATRK